MGYGCNAKEGGKVMLSGKNCSVVEAGHEGVGFPMEKSHDQ
jgi:hypothetical protein